MVALETPAASIGWAAPDFILKATDGSCYSLRDVKGEKGVLVMFICNHCPYVQKQLERMVALAKDLQAIGVGVVAINANDAQTYPEDSFENMQILARDMVFTFPYLYDETQEVARAYGAVCTPDFFGLNAELTLQYRGRLDESWSSVVPPSQRELFEAMKEVAESGKTSRLQNPSVGCSIKWKRGAA